MRVSIFEMRDATPEDAAWFATRLRQSDEDEVLALFDDIEDGIGDAIAQSQIVKVATLHGRPVVILGCGTVAEGHGCPWLLATGEVVKLPGALTRLGKYYTAHFMERWPSLLNYVDERSVASVRWLRRLGFTVHRPEPFGKPGHRFHPFTMGI